MALLCLLYTISVVLPAALFYGWILLFAWLAWRYRAGSIRAVVLAALALVPCALYANQYLTASVRHQRILATIVGAQALPKLAHPPRTLVIHGAPTDSRLEWAEKLVEMGAFDDVYLTGNFGSARLANERNPACGNVRDERSMPDLYRARTGLLVCAVKTSTTRVPDSGLHLYLGATPRTQTGPQDPEPMPISLELRLSAGEHQEIVGYWAIPYVYYPYFPPLLTATGFSSEQLPWKDSVAPNHGELAFIMERLERGPDDLKPRNLPDIAEIRTEYIRRRDSPDRLQQRIASVIAAAVGASALNADDVAPILASDAVDRDLAREVGYQQFCGHFGRLCDFPDNLVAQCKQKRAETALPQAKCNLLPQQCDWCATAQLCQPYTTGSATGCSQAENATRDAELAPLRDHR